MLIKTVVRFIQINLQDTWINKVTLHLMVV